MGDRDLLVGPAVRRRGIGTVVGTVVGTAVSCLLLGGCGLTGGEPAEAAAQTLAGQLSAGSLERIRLTSESDREDLVAVLEGMEQIPVSVTLAGIDSSDSEATATLAWAWSLGHETWEYKTRARLVERGSEWLLQWAPDVVARSLRSGERLDVDTLNAPRGEILGAKGVALVTDRPVRRFGLDKSAVRPAEWRSSAHRIARAVKVDPGDFAERVAAYGDEAFVEAIVLRTEDAATWVDPSFARTPGALAIDDEIPLAPTREFAAPILGSVGPATAELIEAADGSIREGDEVGLSGLQLRYDAQLRGTPGVRIQAVTPDNHERTLFRARPRPGTDLRTTIDPDLQLKVERALAQHLPAEGVDSAVVAIRPSTGDILAAANGPGNDGFNAATEGRYAPGSTFKVVTSLALLRTGLEPDDMVDCPETTLVDGRTFKNYDDYPSEHTGRITLTAAVAHSCNTALIGVRERLSQNALAEAGAALGLGVDHDLGFPAYFGQVPPPQGETEKAADVIGQGKVLAGPLAMAAVAASVQSGRAVLPVLLPDHGADQREPDRPLSTEEATRLRGFMRAVVSYGSASFLADLPGQLGAKTGTAEYGEPDASGALPTHAWMIAARPDLAVAVFVETGDSGSATAGPILEDILR